MAQLSIKILIICCLSLLSIRVIHADTITFTPKIKACIDEGFWYPFTFIRDKTPMGIHVALVQKAVQNIGESISFVSMPWKRCLRETEKGRMDAVVGASYLPERASFFYYPKDANQARSKFRTTQAEYVLVTLASNPYKFTGDLQSIPKPIRIPSGFSMVKFFINKGITIDDSAGSDAINIKRLVRDGKGSVVLIKELADLLNAQVANIGRLHIHSTPIKSKSYFIAFSKKSSISKVDRQEIWQRISELRNNVTFMKELYFKY